MRKKIGDIFYVKVDDKYYFFQFIGIDKAYLEGDVIRVFNKSLDNIAEYNLNEIINSGIRRYINTYIDIGDMQQLFVKISHMPIGKEFVQPEFITTPDNFSEVRISNNWAYWKLGDSDMKKIGQLKNRYKDLPKICGLFPIAVVEYLRTGYEAKQWPK